ncbi:MAG: response regulator [Bacteroidota bacterium]
MHKRFLYIFSFLFLQWQITDCQDYFLSTNTLESDKAIEANIKDFHKDSQGFMWMASSSGIARFDGHRFRLFTTSNSDLRDILKPGGDQLVEDGEGYIWIIGDQTVDLIHHETFEIISFEEKFPDAPFEGHIWSVKQHDKKEIVFRCLQNEKHYSYDSNIGFTELDYIPQSEPGVQPTKDAIWVYIGRDGRISKKYDLRSGKLLESFVRKVQPSLNPIDNYSKEDLFWALSEDSLGIYSAQKDQLRSIIKIPAYNSKSRINASVHYFKKEDKFLVRVDKNKFFIFDLNINILTPIATPKIFNQENFGKGMVVDDILWLSNRKKINLLKLNLNSFEQYAPLSSCRGIWVNDKSLFSPFSKSKTDLTTLKFSRNEKPYFGHITVESNLKDELWIGGRNGIARLDTQTLETLERIPVFLEKTFFWSILKTKNGDWWGGTVSNGIFYKKKEDKSLYPFDKHNEFKAIQSAIHLLEDGENIWAASRDGLYIVHPEKGVLARYAKDSPKEFQIPLKNIYFTFKKENKYWVSSQNDGIIRFEINSEFEIINLKHFTIAEGLPSNTVYTIVEDDNERLWMSTYNGLMVIDPKTENIQIYDKTDGLFEPEFNRNSHAKGQDGRIYFGTLNGVTGFHPDEIIRSSNLDKSPLITQFTVYEKDENVWKDYTQELLNTQKIVLEPSDHFFKLNVSLLDFFDAYRNRYLYKIDGLIEEYQPINGNQLELSGLSYGKYNLRIKGQGADGRDSNHELNLPLIVKRPFYIRPWFLMLTTFIFAISALQLYLWRIRHLSERQKNLELLVEERTAKIQAQAEQLKELDQVKSRFFANISHELRTPLTLILGPIDRLMRNNSMNNRDFTALRMIQQNGNKLLKRINEILDLSRLDANKMEVNTTPTHLYPFIRNIISSVESVGNAKNIQLLLEYHLSEEVQLLLDVDKTEKIISNFLSNAFKFTPQDGEIVVGCKRKGQQLQVGVHDTGLGIPNDELEMIFDRFYQSSNSIDKSGSGIGLALCRELAKILQGKVWAESRIGEGSSFYVELPLVESFAVKTKEEIVPITDEIVVPKPQNTPESTKATVLIVEDNFDLRQYITTILQEDYQIKTAEHGEDALEQLGVENSESQNGKTYIKPDLILTDIMMPIMDGLEFLQHLKKEDHLRHIPTIMLTARQSLDMKLDALRIGVDDYLTKPFNDQELVTRVKNLIENSKNRIVADPVNGEEDISRISTNDLKWLLEVEQVILKNISKTDFILSDVAPQVNMSYSGFRQKVKKITGLSPKEYERTIKLNKAREILKSGTVTTVSEVLHQIGLDNHYHFSKLYKKEFGVMPSDELK